VDIYSFFIAVILFESLDIHQIQCLQKECLE